MGKEELDIDEKIGLKSQYCQITYVNMEKFAILSYSFFIFKIEIAPYTSLAFEWQRMK